MAERSGRQPSPGSLEQMQSLAAESQTPVPNRSNQASLPPLAQRTSIFGFWGKLQLTALDRCRWLRLF